MPARPVGRADIIATVRKSLIGIIAGLAGLWAIRLVAQPAAPAPPPQSIRVNVNTASREQLMMLPGIGAGEVKRIVAGRPYASIGELATKARLSAAALRRIEPRVAFADAPGPDRQTQRPVMRPVPASGARTAPSPPAPLAAAEKADLNTASRDELVQKAHLDSQTAMRIMRARPYGRLADLKRIGFTPERIRELSHFVKVTPPPN